MEHDPSTSAPRSNGPNKHEGSLAESDVLRLQLEEATSLLRVVMQCSSNVIISADMSGIITSLNASAERTLGYTAAEIVGQPISNYLPPDQFAEFTNNLGIIRQGRMVDPYRTQRRRKDGTAVEILTTVAPLMNSANEVIGIVAVAQDLTEVLQLEQQFVVAQKMGAIGQLAGGVAHDFNNLLTVINGYSELALNTVGLDDSMRESLAEIRKAGERARTLTRQILAFSRKQLLEARVVDLNAIVADTEKMLRRLVGEDIILTYKPAPTSLMVKVDAGVMQQSLINLVVNARDAMPQGGSITIETANAQLDESYSRTHAVRPGDYALLAVTDSGFGMDEKTRARIFEPFFTTKGPGKGTGLGLPIVSGIVKQSGGSIDVLSELGRGTTFKIYLPHLRQEVPPATSLDSLQTAPRGTETVLLVEDDDAVRALARYVLLACGYTVLEAANGKDAIRRVTDLNGSLHLLVSDVVMPELGGPHLIKRLRTVMPGLKVLLLSGYAVDTIVRNGVIQANVSFLQKPFTPGTLALKVRQVLDGTD